MLGVNSVNVLGCLFTQNSIRVVIFLKHNSKLKSERKILSCVKYF